MKKKRIKIILVVFGSIVFLGSLAALLMWKGIILPNTSAAKEYEVRGVDVSSYQGEIDWEILSKEDISFAFIKATEGSTFVDKYFTENFSEAQKTNLRVGAYHFFSFDSQGKTQADNFIATVPNGENILPPVVDFEFYGDKEENLPNADDAKKELQILLDSLETHYKKKPIIYATKKAYNLYLSNDFVDYDIWIRNVFTKPTLADGRTWTFWQYTNREELKGYMGEERFIDMNVFVGSKEEFEVYGF